MKSKLAELNASVAKYSVFSRIKKWVMLYYLLLIHQCLLFTVTWPLVEVGFLDSIDSIVERRLWCVLELGEN